MVEQPTPHRLVERAQGGDRQAFEQLVGSHRERLRLFVVSRIKLHIGPRIEPDEILHETFVAAFEGIERFRWQTEDAFFRWLCGIAKHRWMKTTEKSRKHDRLTKDHEMPESGETASQAIRRDERLSRLQRAVDDLPADYGQVIRLARIEGLRIKQIAERMNRSPDAVKHLLARALIRLRESFGDTESLNLPNRHLRFRKDDDE